MDPELEAAQQLVASLRATTPPPAPVAESAPRGSPANQDSSHHAHERDEDGNPSSKTHLDFAKRILAAAFKRPSNTPAANTQFAPGRLLFSFDLSQRNSGPPAIVVRNVRGHTSTAGAPIQSKNDNAALDAAIREIRRARECGIAPTKPQPSHTQAAHGNDTAGRCDQKPSAPITSPLRKLQGRPQATDKDSDSDSDIFGDAGSDYELELDVEAAAAPLEESTSLPAPPTTLKDHSAANPTASTTHVPQKRRHRDIPDDLDAADLDMEMAGAQAGAMGFSRTIVESDEDSDDDLKTLSRLKEQVQHKLATSGVYTADAPRTAKRQKRDHPTQGDNAKGAGP